MVQSHLPKGKSPPTKYHLMLHVLHRKLNVSLPSCFRDTSLRFPSPDYFVDQYLIYVIKSEEGKEEHVSNIVTKEGPRGKKVFKKMP